MGTQHWSADIKESAESKVLSAEKSTLLSTQNSALSTSARLFAGADPWVVRDNGWYYWCNANRMGQIEVWKSRSHLSRGERSVVWSPRRGTWNSSQVWAPELHKVDGKWHIYYAASNGINANHRMGVLECASDDPQDRFIDRGQLDTGNRWAIDGTVLSLHGKLYFLWSGWEDHRDIQHLFIAPMRDAQTIVGERVKLVANNCHSWERVGECMTQRGLHEGPQILKRNGRVFIIYSCSGSWQHTYKLGMLHMPEFADPMVGANWTKHEKPVFQGHRDIFGVGHCCFTQSDDGHDWIVYHSKQSRREGWSDRIVRAQRFSWCEMGMPIFGKPGIEPVIAPKAIKIAAMTAPHGVPVQSSLDQSLASPVAA